MKIRIYFTDFFEVERTALEAYGAFNLSLINDLPVFIDPFLLFGSNKNEYQDVHSSILQYLAFLKNKTESDKIPDYKIKSWYLFPEVKQNWFGYSKIGNGGRGLNMKFGRAFSSSINVVFNDLGYEKITQTSHIEKAALFDTGVGRDNISDFTTNLIKKFLCEYTEKFALKNLRLEYIKKVRVEKAFFDYEFERWMPQEYSLPFIMGDYVLLTPKDILTKDENWINNQDLRADFSGIVNSIPNDQLRHEVFSYYFKKLPKPKDNGKNTQKEISAAVIEAIKKYPKVVDYYVKLKEENRKGATSISEKKIQEVEDVFIRGLEIFIGMLAEKSDFYKSRSASYEETIARVNYLKTVIENNDGYKLFYLKGNPIKREEDLQIIFRLTWYASQYDINREANNGRGPVDYAISYGAADKTIVEFKLASNSKLKQNLKNQVEIYEKANTTKKSIKVILYFDASEYKKITSILKELKLDKSPNIFLIDAGRKISASNVK